MTHKQVSNLNRLWRRHYGRNMPRIVKATEIADASLQGDTV